MKIFVIIVLFNGKKWLNKCVGNLFESTVPLEVIIIDNASTDGSAEYVKNKYPKVELILSAENLGFGKANNIGMKKAMETGADYVFLLNQDAWIEANTIELLLKRHDADYGIISPMHLNAEGTKMDLNFSSYLSADCCPGLLSDLFFKKLKDGLYEVDFVNAAAWLISRKCLDTVGGFSPAFFLYGEDDNYVHRLKYHGLKIGILPSSLVYHDREERTKNIFSKGNNVEDRIRLLNYCDPNKNYDIISDIRLLKKRMLKQILLLRKQEVKGARRLIKELEHTSDIVNQTCYLTKEKGRTFL